LLGPEKGGALAEALHAHAAMLTLAGRQLESDASQRLATELERRRAQ